MLMNNTPKEIVIMTMDNIPKRLVIRKMGNASLGAGYNYNG